MAKGTRKTKEQKTAQLETALELSMGVITLAASDILEKMASIRDNNELADMDWGDVGTLNFIANQLREAQEEMKNYHAACKR